jgi:hypothetical protein
MYRHINNFIMSTNNNHVFPTSTHFSWLFYMIWKIEVFLLIVNVKLIYTDNAYPLKSNLKHLLYSHNLLVHDMGENFLFYTNVCNLLDKPRMKMSINLCGGVWEWEWILLIEIFIIFFQLLNIYYSIQFPIFFLI